MLLGSLLLEVAICQEQFESKEIGATIAGVNIRDLKRVILPVPPHHGQSAMVGFLEEQATMTNDSLDQALGESACPRISGPPHIRLVAANFDMREAAARLHEEPDEPEALDEANTLSNPDEETEVMDEVEE